MPPRAAMIPCTRMQSVIRERRARGGSCPSGEGQRPAASGKDKASFHKSATTTNPGRKRQPPGSIPPRTVWKPQPGVVEPAPPGDDRGPSLDHKSLHTSINPTENWQLLSRGAWQKRKREIICQDLWAFSIRVAVSYRGHLILCPMKCPLQRCRQNRCS